MLKFLLPLLGLIIAPLGAWSHGEDKPGPHGGEIRMPGPFHTELTQPHPGHLQIYLLDMEFKNPTTKNSEVSVKAIGKKGQHEVSCQAEKSYFNCMLDTKKTGEITQFEVKAKRDGAQGNVAKYGPGTAKKDEHAHH